MTTLAAMLRDTDPAVLKVIAQSWGSDPKRQSADKLAENLVQAMQDPEQAAAVFASLDDAARGALQALKGAQEHHIPLQFFQLTYGEIRRMGARQIERERPHEAPHSTAEALYYRGLIGWATDEVGSGLGAVVFMPEELVKVLEEPMRQTGYDAAALATETPSSDATMPGSVVRSIDAERVPEVQNADTRIVDDMTTFLAYVREFSPVLGADDLLPEGVLDILQPYMLINEDGLVDFLVELAIAAKLLEVQERVLSTRQVEIERWLKADRGVQVKALAEAWRDSIFFRELWHTPGLYPDANEGASGYDPRAARQQVLAVMKDLVPPKDWWSLGDFIAAIWEQARDFQRPGGDYESWYIKNDDDEYLKGVESWYSVEGAVLEFMLQGPMHWLGLLSRGEDAAKLNSYGRALLGLEAWPRAKVPVEHLRIEADGTLLASRKLPTAQRYQLARFTDWDPLNKQADDRLYTYHVTPDSLTRAREHGIEVAQIHRFLQHTSGSSSLPESILRVLSAWQRDASQQATAESLVVLRTTSRELLDFIDDKPELRRYLGARLGDTAAVIRENMVDALRVALREHDIDLYVRF